MAIGSGFGGRGDCLCTTEIQFPGMDIRETWSGKEDQKLTTVPSLCSPYPDGGDHNLQLVYLNHRPKHPAKLQEPPEAVRGLRQEKWNLRFASPGEIEQWIAVVRRCSGGRIRELESIPFQFWKSAGYEVSYSGR